MHVAAHMLDIKTRFLQHVDTVTGQHRIIAASSLDGVIADGVLSLTLRQQHTIEWHVGMWVGLVCCMDTA